MGYGRLSAGYLGGEVEEPLSWLLGLAAITFAWGGFRVVEPGFYTSPDFIGILLGFVLHELAHRSVAMRYGMTASFVAFVPGLAITFISGLVPFIVVLAPGYVRTVAYYGVSQRAVLNSVAAGPLTNIVIALAALAGASLPGAGWLEEVALINAYIAFFNLLPIPPLDGSKVMAGSVGIWASMMAVALLLLVAS